MNEVLRYPEWGEFINANKFKFLVHNIDKQNYHNLLEFENGEMWMECWEGQECFGKLITKAEVALLILQGLFILKKEERWI